LLDDCHRVADDGPTLAVLETAQRVCGDHLRIVAISRRAPPPALERGRFGGWLGWVDDLRLGEEEAGLLFETACGRPLDAEERERLAEADGWLAHVLAVARAAPDAGGARR
jgi:ATP/maltotriose-dependent transcriptional regulator MalT